MKNNAFKFNFKYSSHAQRVLGFLLALAISTVTAPTAKAANYTWNGTTTDWAAAGGSNWTPSGTIPGGVTASSSDKAVFDTSGTTAVTFSTNRTIQQIIFQNASQAYTIGTVGGNSLTFFSGTALNGIFMNTAVASNEVVNVPIILKDVAFTGSNGSVNTLTLGGGITSGTSAAVNITLSGTQTAGAIVISGPITDGSSAGFGGVGITLSGTTGQSGFHNYTLSGTNTYSGDTVIGSGTLNLNGTASLSGSTNLAGSSSVSNNSTIFLSTSSGTYTANTFGNATNQGQNLVVSGTSGATIVISNGGVMGPSSGANRRLTVNSGINVIFQNGGVFDISGTAAGHSFEVKSNGVTTFNNTITGTSTLATFSAPAVYMSGTGTLNLTGSNNFVGGLGIQSGTVNYSNLNALSSGTVILGGAGSTTQGGVLQAGVSGTIANNIVIGSGTVATSVTTGTFDTQAFNATVSGNISTSGSGPAANQVLVKAGTGTLTFTNANTFSGTTTVSSGTVNLANQNALQNSTVNMTAAAPAGTTLTFDQSVGGNAFNVGGLSATTGTSTGAGNIALQNNAGSPAAVALSVGGNNGNTTYAAILSGSGSLVKNGTGSLTVAPSFTAIGTISGSGSNIITVTPGTAIFVGQGISGLGQNASNAPYVTAYNSATGAVTVSASGTSAVASGTYTFQGNTYSGGTTLNSGTLTLTNNNSAVAGGIVQSGLLGTGNLTINGGALAGLAGNNPSLNVPTYVVNNSFTIALNSTRIQLSGNWTTSGSQISITSATSSWASTLGASGGSSTIRLAPLTGSGTTSINGNLVFDASAVTSQVGIHFYSGNTFNFVNNSGLTLGNKVVGFSNSSSGIFGSGSFAPALTVSTGGYMSLSTGTSGSINQQVYSLSGGGTVTNLQTTAVATGTLTINNGNGQNFTGVIADGSFQNATTGLTHQGLVALVKSGTGQQTLSGANTYSGATAINGGELRINGSLANTTVTTGSGATLSGTGSIGGLTTISGTGILAPGANTSGNFGNISTTLTFSSGLTLSNGAKLNFDIGGSNTSDTVNVTGGTLTLTGTVGGITLTLNSGNTLTSGNAGTYTLFNDTNAISGGASAFLLSNSLSGVTSAFSLSGNNVILTLSGSTSPATGALTISTATGRVIAGTNNTLSGTLSNTASNPANALAVSLSSTGSTTVNGITSGTSSVAQGASTAVSGSYAASGTPGATNTMVLTNTDGAASPTTASGTTTTTSVANRVITSGTTNLGSVLVGATSATGTSTLTSATPNSQATTVTVLAASASSGGVTVATGTGSVVFDGTTTTANRLLSGSFATSGAQAGSVALSATGEGLANETVQAINVNYTANVYQTSIAGSTLIATGSSTGGGTTADLYLTTGSSTDGGQRAGVTVGGFAGGLAFSNYQVTPQNGGSVAGATTSNVTALVGQVGLKSDRLNGTYSYTGGVTASGTYTDAALALQGTPGNPTWSLILSGTTVNTTAANGVTKSADVKSGQGYAGLSSTHATDFGTVATLLGGTASANTTVNMTFNTAAGFGITDTPAGLRTSDIVDVNGIAPVGGTSPHGATLTDKYVLQLSVDPTAAANLLTIGFKPYIIWFNATDGKWENAVYGNSTPGVIDGTGEFFGSWASAGNTLTLGAFGYDSATNVAWAVLDHTSPFATGVPEPGTYAMALGGFGMLIAAQRMRRRKK